MKRIIQKKLEKNKKKILEAKQIAFLENKLKLLNQGDDQISNNKEEIKFSDLKLIFKDLKTLFQKKGYLINWNDLEKQSLEQTINALAMAIR